MHRILERNEETTGKTWNREGKRRIGFILMICLLAGLFPCHVYATNGDSLVIALDPGHGGQENGANYYGIREKDINLKLAKMVQTELREYQGIDVVLTRENDEEVALWERANRASEGGADILFSLHFNASDAHNSNGASVYISTGERNKEYLMDIGDLLLGAFESIGLDNAGMFARVTQMNDRRSDGSFDDYYGVLRHSYNNGIPAMIIEHCYMDSEVDKQYFYTDEGLKKLAMADATAIAAYYKLCKPGGKVPESKHAAVFGATTKAVERGYYESPQIQSVKLKKFDGNTPGIATFEVGVKDDVGISTLYFVYKNLIDGTTFTTYANLEQGLTAGVHEVTAYFPSKLSLGEYELSYVGAYNEVGLDAGYNHYGETMIGYGKCGWLNTFFYGGEADLNIMQQVKLSPIQTGHIMRNVWKSMQHKRKHRLY